MNRLESLRQKVAAMYEANTPGRAEWAGWLWDQHQPFVARTARELAMKVGANAELAEAAAWLHDIADSVMSRFAEEHESACLEMARKILQETGYSKDEITTVVDDALRLHGCRDGKAPHSLEGKVLATADALAHIKTDFYLFATHAKGKEQQTLQEVKDYALKKLERDFNDKICFDNVREEVRPDYEVIKNLFSRAPVQNAI